MKKNIIYLPAILSVCLAFVMLLPTGCTKDEVLILDYIELSENAYTFDASGDDKLTVTVDASAEWDIGLDVDWISVEKQTGNSITITALPNNEMDTRSTELVFISGMANAKIAVRQIGISPVFAKYSIIDSFNQGFTCSPNGKYVGGIRYTSDETAECFAVIRINTDTWESETLEKVTTDAVVPYVISDNGIFVCGSNSRATFYYGVNGQRHTLGLSAGYRSSFVYGISSDGSVMVGFARKLGMYSNVPCKWVDGVFEELPVPDMDILDEEAITPRTHFYARGCSADGSVIYGSEFNTYQAIYWKDGKVNWVGKDVAQKKRIIIECYDWIDGWGECEVDAIEQPKMMMKNYAISPDGKYLVGTHNIYDTTVVPSVSLFYPFVFDVTTETTTIMTNLPDIDPNGGEALAVSNDGIVSYTTYEAQSEFGKKIYSEGFVYDLRLGVSMKTSDYIEKEYGLIMVMDKAYIYRFCPDNNLIYGVKGRTSMAWTIQW